MHEGTHRTLQELTCPCGHSEIADELGQYDTFDFLHCSPRGLVQVWKCRKCGQKFKITLE